MDETTKALDRQRTRGVPHKIPGYGPQTFEPAIVPAQLGALRVLAVPFTGLLNATAASQGFTDLDAALATHQAAVQGPPLVLLNDDPFIVHPPKRKYLFARAVRGPVAIPADGKLVRVIADGGFFVRLRLPKGLAQLEAAVAYLFGAWMVDKSYQLAAPMIRLHFDVAGQKILADSPLTVEVPAVLRMVMGAGRESSSRATE